MIDLINQHRKFLIALAGAVVAILGRHLGLANPLYVDVVTLLTAVGVYSVPNTP